MVVKPAGLFRFVFVNKIIAETSIAGIALTDNIFCSKYDFENVLASVKARNSRTLFWK